MDKKEEEEKKQWVQKDWLIPKVTGPDSVVGTEGPAWIGQKQPCPHSPIRKTDVDNMLKTCKHW